MDGPPLPQPPGRWDHGPVRWRHGLRVRRPSRYGLCRSLKHSGRRRRRRHRHLQRVEHRRRLGRRHRSRDRSHRLLPQQSALRLSRPACVARPVDRAQRQHWQLDRSACALRGPRPAAILALDRSLRLDRQRAGSLELRRRLSLDKQSAGPVPPAARLLRRRPLELLVRHRWTTVAGSLAASRWRSWVRGVRSPMGRRSRSRGVASPGAERLGGRPRPGIAHPAPACLGSSRRERRHHLPISI